MIEVIEWIRQLLVAVEADAKSGTSDWQEAGAIVVCGGGHSIVGGV